VRSSRASGMVQAFILVVRRRCVIDDTDARAEALLDRLRATGVHVERSCAALDDLLRDHDLLDALETW
jgi:hypothetical protein